MSAPIPTSSSAEHRSRWRQASLSALLWVYGISITVFLFSIWGRAVAADTDLLSNAASQAADSDMVSSQVEAWFEGALAGAGVGNASGALSDMIVALPEVRSATGEVAGDLVRAAAESSNVPVIIDVASAYRPAVPAVTSALASAGVPVGEEQVAEVVEELDPLILRTDDGPPVVGPDSRAVRSLTIATVIAALSMISSGGWAVMLSGDRRAMTRTLLNRLAVSAFSYAVFFRLSSWVLDPGGGRASIRGGFAQVVGSNLWIPLVVTAVAAGGGWALRHRGMLQRPRRAPWHRPET